MQSLIVSMMRLSTAATLYGLEQIESSMGFIQGEQDFNKILDRFQSAIDSLSDVLVNNMGTKKKDTLKSITETTEDVVRRSFDGIGVIAPREMMKATTDLLKQSSDTVAGWVSKVTAIEGEEPKPAAEVLA